jgi:hypothetical protein
LKAKGKILTVGIPVACLCMGEKYYWCLQTIWVARLYFNNPNTYFRCNVSWHMLCLHNEIGQNVGFM